MPLQNNIPCRAAVLSRLDLESHSREALSQSVVHFVCYAGALGRDRAKSGLHHADSCHMRCPDDTKYCQTELEKATRAPPGCAGNGVDVFRRAEQQRKSTEIASVFRSDRADSAQSQKRTTLEMRQKETTL